MPNTRFANREPRQYADRVPTSARPKRHHFVTEAYLTGFLEPGQDMLFCWGRFRERPFRARPQNLAIERNYYSVKKDGTWDDTAEKLLAESVEDPGLIILRKLAAGKTRLDWGERNALALLLSFQELRVPFFRNAIQQLNVQLLTNILKDYEKNAHKLENPETITLETRRGLATFPVATLKRALEEDKSNPEKQSLMLFGGIALDIAAIYESMKWTLCCGVDRRAFVTSDCPVIRFFHDEGGSAALSREDIEIRFPLSRSAMLTLTHDIGLYHKLEHASKKERMRMLSRVPEIRVAQFRDGQVDEANRTHAAHASFWMFSGQELEWAREVMGQRSRNYQMVVRSERDGYRLRAEVQNTGTC